MGQVESWYLVQCKPRQDERAEENLCRQGYVCVRPIFKRDRVFRGRAQRVTESLFPSYLFIRMSEDADWGRLRSTRGVSRIVGFGGKPLAVSDQVISEISSRSQLLERDEHSLGDRIEILERALSPIEAIFLAMDGEERALILISILDSDRCASLPLKRI
ncbi:transcription/translation regulatory transformer protein RfaH [Pseudomonas gingeri]